jgi:predicted small metal-binding protein
MVKVSCSDYGFDCDFILDDGIEHAVKKYNEHSEEIHGIEYVKEDLEQRFLELANSQ